MSTSRAVQTVSIDGRPVGRIGLGCMGMSFAYAPDDGSDDPTAVITAALDAGVDLIDTADVYGPFTNEEVVGTALRGQRDRAFLATKVGLEVTQTEPSTVARNGRPDHIRAAVDGSLQRLAVDRIDLYQLHRVDPEVPVHETWGAMAEAVTAGKVAALGMSEVTVEQLDAAHAIHPVASVQSELSLWTRQPLEAVVPWCAGHGAAFIAFSPLGRGFLTGTIRAGRTFGSNDFRSQLPRFTPEALDDNEDLIRVVESVAAAREATPGQVALSWLLAQSPTIVAIPGTRRVSRVRENAAAAGMRLTAAELEALDAAPLPEQDRY